MFRNLYLLILAVITSLPAMAQLERDVREARPEGGIEALADIYHRIRFNEVQERQMRGARIQLLFKVSRQGEAQLYKVDGVWEQSLKDSLFSRNDSLPRFEPRSENGFAGPSFYALGLRFPDGFTRIPESGIEYILFGINTNADDLRFVQRGGQNLFFLMGAAGNVLTGKYSDHYQPGYGFFIELVHQRKKKPHAYILELSFFLNGISDALSIETERELSDPMSNVVFDIGYSFFKGNNAFTPFFSIMLSNVISGGETEGRIQETRYGVGFAYTRKLPIFKEKFTHGSEGPALLQRGVSVSLRPTYYFAGSDIFGRGAMFSLLIGYYSGSQRVIDYRFKDSFYE